MLSKEQLEMRRHGVTGTDIAAILGRSEHRSPLDVFREKVGLAEPLDLTPALKRGMYLEDGIRRWYAADTGAVRVEEVGTLALKGQPRIMATPDGVALFGKAPDGEVAQRALAVMAPHMARAPRANGGWERRGLEIKSPGPFMEHGWGEPGTDEVPDAYLLQGVFEMAVLDVERLDFAALLGGELCIYPVQRNRELESWLIEYALKWWRDFVEAGREPAPTPRERDVEFITRRLPRATKPHLAWEALTPEQRLVVEQLVRADKLLKETERNRKELELRAKLIIGEAGGIALPPTPAKGTPEWESFPEALRGAKRLDWQNTKARPLSYSAALEDVRSRYEALLAGASAKDMPAFDALLEPHRGENPRPFTIRSSKKGEE